MTKEEWLEIPYEDRLDIVEFIFRQATKEGCSFRALIYDRLGFKPDAYEPLYTAGGMMITNALAENELT